MDTGVTWGTWGTWGGWTGYTVRPDLGQQGIKVP